MIYHTKVRGTKLFEAQSDGYGQPVETFGLTDQGETPVSLLTIALASCVTMCVQGYFAKVRGDQTVQVQVALSYDETSLTVGQTIQLNRDLALDEQAALLNYIDDRCKVKKLLRDDLIIETSFVKG